jgi:hypothetical protein
VDNEDLLDSELTYTEQLERDINRAETLAAHLEADLVEVRAENERLRTQRAAALAIHERCDDDPGGPPYCRVCIQGGNDFAAAYPCSTARSLGVTA